MVNHCDKNVIAAFMAPEAHTTYVIVYGVINELRELRSDPKYADELVQIREWHCTLTESANNPVALNDVNCNPVAQSDVSQLQIAMQKGQKKQSSCI